MRRLPSTLLAATLALLIGPAAGAQPAAPAGDAPAEGGDAPAEAGDDAPAAPAAAKARAEVDRPAARAALDRLTAATTAAERLAAAKALAELSPPPVADLERFLARARSSTDEERRAVLISIGAELPDEKGKFKAPARQTVQTEAENDAFDWLAKLVDLDARTPGLADAIADVAAIRALAGKDPDGAAAILDFAFTPEGTIYRDECGRYLRRMAPWSLPALIRGSEKSGEGSRARYATYQLERLDRQNPRKALADAPNDELKIEVLRAFQDSLYREAVFVVLDTVDDVSPGVRKAAREAWMEYATGRAPKPAPKQKLQLPGGKLTDKEMPLWLNSRELADIAIRRRLEALTGQAPAPRAKLAEMSQQLFAFYDDRRTAALGVELDRALALHAEGKTAEAAALCDRILVQAPDLARRAETAPVYLAVGDAAFDAAQYPEAARAYGKAAAMAGDSEVGHRAMARHHEARGKAAEAKGESAAAEFALAREASAEAGAHQPAAQRAWMLWAGIGIALGGLALLALGWALRRR